MLVMCVCVHMSVTVAELSAPGVRLAQLLQQPRRWGKAWRGIRVGGGCLCCLLAHMDAKQKSALCFGCSFASEHTFMGQHVWPSVLRVFFACEHTSMVHPQTPVHKCPWQHILLRKNPWQLIHAQIPVTTHP